MKIANKLFLIFILGILCVFSSNRVFAEGFNSNHISLNNDEKSTIEKEYPVIIAKNTTDRDLLVTYNFYSDEEEKKFIYREISIPKGESVIIEIPELSVLGKTGNSRRIWFNWNEPEIRKPLGNQIDTYPFKNKDKPPIELG